MSFTAAKRYGENSNKSANLMWLPSQNRLTESDPLGFYAGDTNLYRFVGNDPTTSTDPSGLQQEKQVETIKGRDVSPKKNTLKFNGGTGTVKVLIEATLKNRKGVQIEGWIQIQFTADVDVPADTHWLQFVQRKVLDKDGKKVPGSFLIRRGGKLIRIKNGEEGRFVDCDVLPDTKLPPYYDTDTKRGTFRRGPREITIFDKPAFDPTARDYSEQTFIFDTFLISEGKVYYHLQWKFVATVQDGKWVGKYADVKGEPVDKLPDWANKDQLHGGFFPDENNDPGKPIEYPNPIPKANR